MIFRWLKGLTDYIHKGYNSFLYSANPSDTTGPTIMYGFSGR